jgi:electron transfer flavoprotein alpha subunit
MTTLVLAEHDNGVLTATTARLVNAVAALGPVHLLVAGERAGEAATAVALAGVEQVYVTDAAPDALVAIVEGLAPSYTHIVAAAATAGRDLIPRLAARLDLMPVTDIVGIHGPDRFERPIYAGNAIETVVSNQPRQLLTIRASAFRPAAAGPTTPVETLASATAGLIRVLSRHRTESDRPELATAQVVVSGGIAFGSAENFRLVEDLAAVLGAAVGATRAAVDAGYAPNDWQVGQTGKIVAPDLYIGIGVSGALQHLAGIQGAKKIVAINSDPEAPLMKLADYALVGDLFEIVPQLIEGLKRG